MPRKKKPRVANLNEVNISRNGWEAIIEFRDSETGRHTWR